MEEITQPPSFYPLTSGHCLPLDDSNRKSEHKGFWEVKSIRLEVSFWDTEDRKGQRVGERANGE